jgi:hypothetical protein
MHLSVFDIFKIGIGPSSSHTVGPMRAARRFAQHLDAAGLLAATAAVKIELFGSLGFTGKGHGSDVAVILGLEGEDPETVDVDAVPARVAAVAHSGELRLLGRHTVELLPASAILFRRRETLPLHSNGMRFTARAADGAVVAEKIFYSVGGGFVVGADAAASARASSPAASRCAAAPPRSTAGCAPTPGGVGDPLTVIDWVNLFALAVNEENAAAGGSSPRRPTAPPASSRRCCTTTARFIPADDDGTVRFLLTAGAIGGAVQGERVDLRRRGRLPGRGRRRLLDGRRRAREVLGGTPARSRTPPRSAWSTTSASPATRSAAWCRCRASSATRWAR